MSEPGGTIRAERPGDEEAIAFVVTEAFGRTLEAELVERLRADHPDVYGPSLVAEVDDTIVGHVLLCDDVVKGPGSRRVHTLGPVAVERSYQHLGIGSTLVVRARDLATAPVVLLGDPRWYGRLGFEPAEPHGLRCWWPDVGDAWQVWLPPGDWRAWSGVVRYPAPFEELAEEVAPPG